MRLRILLVLGAAILATGASAQEDWPSRPIRLIVPVSAGGGHDLMARTLAFGLSQQLPQRAIVSGRSGHQRLYADAREADTAAVAYFGVRDRNDSHKMNLMRRETRRLQADKFESIRSKRINWVSGVFHKRYFFSYLKRIWSRGVSFCRCNNVFHLYVRLWITFK